MPSDNEKKRTTLQTAERALRFLETVAQAPTPRTLKDIATELDLNISTAYHLLNTLQVAGYLTRDPDGGLRIAARAAVLYQGLVRQFHLGRDLYPIVEELAAKTQETAYLCSASEQGAVVQALVEGTQSVRVRGHHVGFSGHEHLRASGKAVLAHLPLEKRIALLANNTELDPETRAATLDELKDEFTAIQRQGWALDERGYDPAVCCAAAPFFNSTGTVAGSIAVSVPSVRFFAARETLCSAVPDAAQSISRMLGHITDETPTVGVTDTPQGFGS